MRATLSFIPPKVTHRACPGCGYMLSQFEVEACAINYECARCGHYRLSEFKPVDMVKWRTDVGTR